MAEYQHAEARKQPERAHTAGATELEGKRLDLLLQRTAAASYQRARLDPRTLTPQAILGIV